MIRLRLAHSARAEQHLARSQLGKTVTFGVGYRVTLNRTHGYPW